MNKVETRVEAIWDLEASTAISEEQRARIRSALGRRVSADGAVRITSQTERTQRGNRQAAIERLRALVAAALVPRRSRRATAKPKRAKEARLESKRRRAAIKRDRSVAPGRDD